MKFFLCTFYVFQFFVTSFCYGAASSTYNDSVHVSPSKRILNVHSQLHYYEEMYDKAYVHFLEKGETQGSFEFFYSHHIDGLYDMFIIGYENVFQLLSTHEEDSLRQLLFSFLNKIKEIASFQNKNKKMTQALFVELNRCLARIADYNSRQIQSWGDQTQDIITQSLTTHFDDISYAISHELLSSKPSTLRLESQKNPYIEAFIRKDLGTFLRYSSLLDKKIPPVFEPIIILYTSDYVPTTEFVKFGYGKEYKSSIAQFDINLLVKEKRTKKDPHFSDYLAPYAFLDHDLFHIRSTFLYQLIFPLFENNYEDLKYFYTLSQSDALSLNDRQLIENVLFLLGHELACILPSKDFTLASKKNWVDIIETLSTLMTNYIREFAQEEGPRGITYKLEYRDLEFALKDKSRKSSLIAFDGKPLLPPDFSVKPRLKLQEERQEEVINAFSRFWETFQIILENIGFLEKRHFIEDSSHHSDIQKHNYFDEDYYSDSSSENDNLFQSDDEDNSGFDDEMHLVTE